MSDLIKCKCGNEATQLLSCRTRLIENRGHHYQGDVWNSILDERICDECSTKLFVSLELEKSTDK